MPQDIENFFDVKNPEFQTQKICQNYLIFHIYGRIYYIFATLMIFVFNAFFYMIIEPLIDKIGYHHKTDQNALVMFTVFVCLCADMIALPVIIGFNFEEHFDQQLIGEVFKGKYTDFSDEWFKDVGYQITLSIFIFALMPIVNQFVEF